MHLSVTTAVAVLVTAKQEVNEARVALRAAKRRLADARLGLESALEGAMGPQAALAGADEPVAPVAPVAQVDAGVVLEAPPLDPEDQSDEALMRRLGVRRVTV